MNHKISKYIVWAMMIVLAVGFLFPMYWMVMLSFKDIPEIVLNPFGLPAGWELTNYIDALAKMEYWTGLRNSVVYTFGTCALTLLFGSMASYAVSRMGWKHGEKVRSFFMLGLLIPIQLVLVPLYTIIFKLGLKGTPFAVILPYTAFQLPSTILMLYAFLRGIPRELDEAARLDGCGSYRVFFNILLPVLKPAMSTRFIMIFISIWNEYNLALVLANTNDTRPLTIELNKFFGTLMGIPHWGQIGAAMLLASAPVIVMYCLGSSKIENALCAGAILK